VRSNSGALDLRSSKFGTSARLMCVSSYPALTGANSLIFTVYWVVGKSSISVGKYPKSCVKLVEEMWVTSNFSLNAQVKRKIYCG